MTAPTPRRRNLEVEAFTKRLRRTADEQKALLEDIYRQFSTVSDADGATLQQMIADVNVRIAAVLGVPESLLSRRSTSSTHRTPIPYSIGGLSRPAARR